ncbi:MAG TPA: hypothetical protein VGI22_14660 [Xanthobacteraceae bacterium]|jgi:hypothetical protein
MRTPLLAIFCAASLLSPARAASVTVSDMSAALPGVAADVTAMLLDAGLKARRSGGAKFTVAARGLHCDRRSNAPLDAAHPHAGLPTLKCRLGARNLKDTRTGRPFAEARAITDLLQKIQDSSESGGVQFGDCASGGYCGTYVLSIACIIDTSVENFSNGGRWACTFTDGQ